MPKKNTKLTRFKQKIESWTQRLLKGTHDYFFCELPDCTGLISSGFLKRFYSGVYLGSEQTDIFKRLPPDSICVITTKYKSYFEYLFYHTRYRHLRLPVPELAFDYDSYLLQPVSRICRAILAKIDFLFKNRRFANPYKDGFYKRSLLSSKCAMLSLVEKKGFYRRFIKSKDDPVEFLIRLQKEIAPAIYIVPHLMFFDKRPSPVIPGLLDILFGSNQRPGILRRIATLIRKPGAVFSEISQPVNLKHFIEQPAISGRSLEYQALSLRRKLLLQNNKHRQSITGPVIKSSEEIKEGILTQDRMNQFMKHHAVSRNEPLSKIRKKADAYIDEIAAKYSPGMIRFLSVIVGWITNSIYDGAVIGKTGLNRIKEMSRKSPLVFIPCHKSHIDYLILSYVLYQNNMACPHIAAGKNLSFWPLGPIFRSGGAFFLRRTFKGSVLYANVFAAYIHKLLEEGFNIEQFIEGGRSRTGKLLIPKLGLVSILINAFKNNACKDLVFVPVYIGYDRILEENAYIHELEGGKKEPENLSQVIRARKFLKKRYGKIYINFHEPISTREILSTYQTPLYKMDRTEQAALGRDIGWRIINAIGKETVVTPHGLAAAAILNTPGKRFTKQDFFENVNTYLKLLVAVDAGLADTLLINSELAFDNVLEDYIQRKILETPSKHKNTSLDQAFYIINAAKRSLMEYYKNNCISYFVNAALTAMAILEKDAFQFSAADLHSRFQFHQNFFKYEFAYDVEKPPEHLVRKTIKAFIDDAILMPHRTIPDTYNITSTGLRKLKLFARFLKPYLESYRVVLIHMKQNKKKEMPRKKMVKSIQAIGEKMYKNNEIELIESISYINYQNGIQFFMSKGIKTSDHADKITDYEKMIYNSLAMIDK